MTNHDLVAHAQALLDANSYLTLATADPEGRPWTSPVYFAASGRWEFYWVSAADAQHSLNLTGRPQVSLVVFDSTVVPYPGRAVYAVGDARELSGDDLNRGLEISRAEPSRRGTDNTRGRDGIIAVPPLPGDGVRPVGPLSARAQAALPAARSRSGPPGPCQITLQPASAAPTIAQARRRHDRNWFPYKKHGSDGRSELSGLFGEDDRECDAQLL